MKKRVLHQARSQHERRDEEVVRANRELAAYFKGRRTEREARAALKIIKAFIRDRERADPNSLAPLPGTRAAGRDKARKPRKIKAARKSPRRKQPDTPPPPADSHPQEEST